MISRGGCLVGEGRVQVDQPDGGRCTFVGRQPVLGRSCRVELALAVGLPSQSASDGSCLAEA